jgi:hypothetical protein
MLKNHQVTYVTGKSPYALQVKSGIAKQHALRVKSCDGLNFCLSLQERI